MLTYKSVAQLVHEADKNYKTIGQLVLSDQALQMEITEAEVLARMKESLDVMEKSTEKGLKPGLKSVSGLTGGDGYKAYVYAQGGNTIGGNFCATATAISLAIQEYNAAMGKIVAAPTAGSCGVLPAGVLTMMQQKNIPESTAIMALITSGAIGMVIANEASVSGAQGGCQAECGSAAAMTAAALVEMSGGNNKMVAHAAAIALQNLLGLVCDPVAGLVEVPCILRNGGSIAIAINAADMALAGIESIIPIDEVIWAMNEVGNALPESLRETSQGGLAATPTGKAIYERIFG